MAESVPIPIHNRSYVCEAFKLRGADGGDDQMMVRGRVTDTKPYGISKDDGDPLTIHDMVIELVLAPADFEILSVNVTMETHPYDTCVAILPDYQQLVGRSIARGYSKAVRELFGGPNGCSHVGALLTAMGPVAHQAAWNMRTVEQTAQEQIDEEVDPADSEDRTRRNVNTCHVWEEDGEHLRAIASGEDNRDPRWVNVRLAAVAARNAATETETQTETQTATPNA